MSLAIRFSSTAIKRRSLYHPQRHRAAFSSENGKESSLGVRKDGDILDELGALRDHSQEYSVRASAKTELLFIPRAAFRGILEKNKAATHFITNYAAIRMAGGIVNRLFDLKGKVAHSELEQYVSSVGVKRLSAGKTILEQDSQDDRRLYIIHQGKVKLYVQKTISSTLLPP